MKKCEPVNSHFFIIFVAGYLNGIFVIHSFYAGNQVRILDRPAAVNSISVNC